MYCHYYSLVHWKVSFIQRCPLFIFRGVLYTEVSFIQRFHYVSYLSYSLVILLQTLELAADSQPFMQEVHTPLGRGSSGDLISGPRGVGEEWWPLSLRYKHFQLPQIETLIQHCCQLLGFHGSLSSILDHLLDAYLSPFTQRRCELLIMIGHVLLGAGGRGCVHSRERVRGPCVCPWQRECKGVMCVSSGGGGKRVCQHQREGKGAMCVSMGERV